jgi:hypothetical protein
MRPPLPMRKRQRIDSVTVRRITGLLDCSCPVGWLQNAFPWMQTRALGGRREEQRAAQERSGHQCGHLPATGETGEAVSWRAACSVQQRISAVLALAAVRESCAPPCSTSASSQRPGARTRLPAVDRGGYHGCLRQCEPRVFSVQSGQRRAQRRASLLSWRGPGLRDIPVRR